VKFFYMAGYADIYEAGHTSGLTDRLRQSLARVALDRGAEILWPEDLPYPPDQREPVDLHKIPPTVHPAFLTQQTRPVITKYNDLPEAYFLYHGPCNPGAIQTLLRTWSWVAVPIGKDCPLVLVGLDQLRRQRVYSQLSDYALEETLQVLPALSPQELAGLYQGCRGLFHHAPESLWEGPVRQALASGRPVVAAKTDLAEALVGPAAYLIDERDTRAMGAALITIVVEESITESLSQAAQARSIRWNQALFREKLALIYQTVGGN
jgi:hypothetical protein